MDSTKSYDNDVVIFLLNNGFNNIPYLNKSFERTIQFNSYNLFKLLIEYDIDYLNIISKDDSLINLICKQINMIRYLYTIYPNIIHINNDKPIKYAVINDDLELTNFLIECGVDLLMNNNYLIKLASEYNSINVGLILIKYNINISIDDNYPIKKVCECGYLEFFKILLKHDNELIYLYDELIEIATENKRSDIILYLQNNFRIKN
jgi:hypothetical protein